MKRHSMVRQGKWFFTLVNISLTLLLIFFTLPGTAFEVKAQSDTSEGILLSDNITTDNITTENLTEQEPLPSENVTPEEPPADDEVILEEPPPSDNVTPEEDLLPDDEIPEEEIPTENVTPEEEIPTDNVTPEEEIPTDNITPKEEIPTENITVEMPVNLVKPDEEAEIFSASKKITLRIPRRAVSVPVEIEIAEHAPPGSTGMRMVNLFELNAYLADFEDNDILAEELSSSDNDTTKIPPLSDNSTPEVPSREVTQFNKELEITIQHTAKELRGLDLDSLRLYYLDEESKEWRLVESSRFDPESLVLTATLDHFSYYGEQADPLQVGPGRVMAAETDLHSGAATYSYPIELPPGPGGFKPSLTLTYNSGSIDEMKNKRDVGSWVGTGWSLHLGRISRDLTTEEYFLDLNGASYELISSDNIDYHTQPEQYFKITRSDNTWVLLDREGVSYEFGGTTNSTQYVYDTTQESQEYYRWDLSQIEDTNGNTANVNYVQEIRGTSPNDTVRSAYTENLTYGNVLVDFNIEYDLNAGSDGYLRWDNPKTYGSNAAPKVMETRWLDSIEVKFDGSPIRKYDFTYNTTNCTYSSDYSGIYYAGKHTLTSITQLGVDGTSELPATTFTYQDKQVYRKTSETQYSGNPGNPASLARPYLTMINSGYGGSVQFVYTQIPGTSVFDTWTRQAVTQKKIYDGINEELNEETMTFYPNAGTGSNGVDGQVSHKGDETNGLSWDQIHDGTGTHTYPAITTGTVYLRESVNQGWWVLARTITGFDTSGLPDDAIITSSVLSIYGSYKADSASFSPSINVYSAAPASNSNLVAGDYDSLGTTPYCNTPISYTNFSTSGYNDFALNATGIAAINKTGVTNFGWREVNADVVDVEPNCPYDDLSYLSFYMADNGSNKPKLVVTYIDIDDAPSETYTYTYNDNPQYLGTGWDQEYRGFDEVRETDAVGNYIKHFFFTNKNAEVLTGREYQTEWYDSSNNTQKQRSYDWGIIASNALKSNWLEGWDNRIEIIIDSTKIDSDLTHFPLLLHLSSSSGQNGMDTTGIFDELGSNQKKLAVTTEDEEYQLYVDIEKWDSNNREAWLWVSDSNWEISSSENTTLYLYYDIDHDDNTDYVGSSNSTSAANVWDDNFVLVDHMQDASSSTTTDSSGNGNHGTKKGADSPSENVSGLIGSCQMFDGNDDYISQSISGLTSNYTIELLVNSADYTAANLFRGATYPYEPVVCVSGSTNKVSICGQYYQSWLFGSTAIPNDEWNYLASVFENKYKGSYINADLDVQMTEPTYANQWDTTGHRFGVSSNLAGYYYGLMDEARISNAARSVAWIKATYHTCWDDLLCYYPNYSVHLVQVEETTYNATSGNMTSRTRYEYDDYGNVVTEYLDGDTGTSNDNATIWRVYYPNTTANILGKVARERVYAGTATVDNGTNLKKETLYYYDGNNSSLSTPPTKGNLTHLEQKKDASNSVSSYFTYYANGNKWTSTDPNNNTTNWTYKAPDYIYPDRKTLPNDSSENYTYDLGTSNLLGVTDINGQTTNYYYDTFKRLIKAVKPGDSSANASIVYIYDSWGTIGKQNITILTKIAENNYLWQKDYFDGLSRVIQTQTCGEDGYTIISSTTAYDNRGLTEKEYVPLVMYEDDVNGYIYPLTTAGWLSGWDNRVAITIDSSNIDSNLTHFPVLIHLSDSSGQNNDDLTAVFDEIGGNYSRIAVTTDDGETQLYVEVEKWDAANEEAWLWVSESDWEISSSEDTTLYLYYDNDHDDNTSFVGDSGSAVAQNVWDDSFELVDHMKDASTTTTTDSTGNNNGTKKGANEPVQATAQIGKGQTTDGSNDYIDYGVPAFLPADAATLEVIVYIDPAHANMDGQAKHLYSCAYGEGGYSIFFDDRGGSFGTNSICCNARMDNDSYLTTRIDNVISSAGYYYIAAAFDKDAGDGEELKLYVQAVKEDTATGTNPLKTSTKHLIIGAYASTNPPSSAFAAAKFDEARASDTARPAAWIKATYYTCWDDLTTFSMPEESGQFGASSWRYRSYTYDALGRVITQTNADNTTVSHDYSTTWQDLVTNERGYNKRYYYDAFNRLSQVVEYNSSNTTYATTSYTYDVLSNLTQVTDADSNTTSMTYNWLSLKTAMTDPDMGSWSYGYDANGNLTSQTDARSQTVNMTYDALNRLTGKLYPAGSNTADVTYTYDSTDGGNYGKGRRTGMTDALGTTIYKYDARGRLTSENRTADAVDYVTGYTYDSADRNIWTLYPTGENVTQSYNGRGFVDTLYGSVVEELVNGTQYNALGLPTEIDLGNGLKTTFGYWGIDNGTASYGRLWEIKTQLGENTPLQQVRHTWDAGGNLYQRQDVLASETETFSYDFLDRLLGVTGPYTDGWEYSTIGNISSHNGTSYQYPTNGVRPHAVSSVGGVSYAYDANGNMTARGSQTITWDAENRPVTVTDNGTTTTFVYDGDGNRVKKTENGEAILYVNKYYEKNITTGNITTSYYLGDRLIAQYKGAELQYVHQDHLTGTSVVTSNTGSLVESLKYFPFGATRSLTGTDVTDKKFTRQRLDGTGLYYYNARYYDPVIGRFISPDTIVPNPANPQSFNRYAYCLNNPLRYIDPSGHVVTIGNSTTCYWYFAQYSNAPALNAMFFAPEMALSYAWAKLCDAAPTLTQTLKDAKEIVNIKFGELEGIGAKNEPSKEGANITIGNDSLKSAMGSIAGLIGHEAIHAMHSILFPESPNTIFAESTAIQFGNSVAVRLGSSRLWDLPLPNTIELQSGYNDKWLGDKLLKTQVAWSGLSPQLTKDYGTLDLFPSQKVFDALQTQVIQPTWGPPYFDLIPSDWI